MTTTRPATTPTAPPGRRLVRGPRSGGLAAQLAMVLAGAVLALAAAAPSPTLVAAGDAATVAELERVGRLAAGFSLVADGRLSPEVLGTLTAAVAAELGSTAGPAMVALEVDPVTLVTVDSMDAGVRLVAATDALERLGAGPVTELGAGGAGPDTTTAGLVVPEVLADELDLEPGDEVTVGRGDRTTTATIVAIADLAPEDAPAGLEDRVEAAADAVDPSQRPIDLVVVAPETLLRLADDLAARSSLRVMHPVPASSDRLSDLQRGRARAASVSRAAADPRTELGGIVAEVLPRAPSTHSGAGAVVREARAARDALAGPARATGVAGQLVALAVVAAAAAAASRARSVELRLAAVRGRSPFQQGAAAAFAALPALAAGAAVGGAAAVALVIAVQPGTRLSPAAVRSAGFDVGIALVPALAIIGAVTATVVAGTLRTSRRRWLTQATRFPWEVLVLGLATVALVQLRVGGGVSGAGGGAGLHPLVLAFPALLLAGALGLTVRAARRGLPLLRRTARHAGPARYLAVRRLAADAGAGLLLTAATAFALGLVVYSASLAASLDVAVDDKAVLQLGADAVAPANGIDLDTVGDAALVWRTRARLGPANVLADLLLVDPDTWGSVTSRALSTPLISSGGLAAVPGEEDQPGRLGILAAGAGTEDAIALDVATARVPITVLERFPALPGQSPTRPMVVADAATASGLLPPATDADAPAAGRWRAEVWAAGTDAGDRLVAGGADPATVRTAVDDGDRPLLVAVSWGLAALQAFAILATVLALAGVLLFVAGRQRATQVSYALARRMGLAAPVHRTALSLQVVTLLAVSLTLAAVLGLTAAALVAGALDPLPAVPPPPRPVVPWATLGLLAGLLVLAGLIGAAALQRVADRADVAEVLRRG